jgi:hypothetical protein
MREWIIQEAASAASINGVALPTPEEYSYWRNTVLDLTWGSEKPID